MDNKIYSSDEPTRLKKVSQREQRILNNRQKHWVTALIDIIGICIILVVILFSFVFK